MAKKKSSRRAKRSPTYKGDRVVVTLRMPRDVMRDVDAVAKECGLSRNDLIVRVLRTAAATRVEDGGLFVGGIEELLEEVVLSAIQRAAETGTVADVVRRQATGRKGG